MVDVLNDVVPPVLAWVAALTAAFTYWRGRSMRKSTKPRLLSSDGPRGAIIEIVEKGAVTEDTIGGSVIVPNDVRINGQSLLASADEPVVVHEVSTSADDCVRVTLTLLARRVSMRAEGDTEA